MSREVTLEEYTAGCKNITIRQLTAYRALLTARMPHKIMSDKELREAIMAIVITRPICCGCLKKDPATLLKLTFCSECKTEWYCSATCKENHRPIHEKYCCKPDGDWPYNSPYRPAVVSISVINENHEIEDS